MKIITSLLSLLLASAVLSRGQSIFFGIQNVGGTATNTLTPVPASGTLVVDYDFLTLPDTMDVYFGNVNIFSSGLVSFSGEFSIPYGPGAFSDLTIIMNQGGALETTQWSYTPRIDFVPEPGSVALIAFGLSGFALWRIFKQRSASLKPCPAKGVTPPPHQRSTRDL